MASQHEFGALDIYVFVVCSSYRIRLPTEKELEMKISKAVKKTRFFEATLLSSYKVCSCIGSYSAITVNIMRIKIKNK